MVPQQKIRLAEVGKRLNLFRRIMGQSWEELAADLKTTVQDLLEIEKGEKEDVLTPLAHLAVEYGLDLSWLFTNEQTIFFKKGPKVPQELYDLVTMLPLSHPECTLEWVAEQMDKSTGKSGLHQLYLNMKKRSKEWVEQHAPTVPSVESKV